MVNFNDLAIGIIAEISPLHISVEELREMAVKLSDHLRYLYLDGISTGGRYENATLIVGEVEFSFAEAKALIEKTNCTLPSRKEFKDCAGSKV